MNRPAVVDGATIRGTSFDEAVRQGFYPGSRPPFGYRKVELELRPGVMRHALLPDESEAALVREVFHLSVTHGALKVAESLNERGLAYREGKLWTKEIVLGVLEEPSTQHAPARSRKRLPGARVRCSSADRPSRA